MKKSHFLIATLCASALVLSACTLGQTTKKKKKKSSSSQITSVEPGTSSGGQPTSGGGQSSVTPGSSGTPTPSTSTPTPKTLDSIAVTTQPTKTQYKAGEQFDPSGMVVTASYSDGSTANVTSQCTFSPTTLAEGDASVTVSFGGKTTSVAVTVSKDVPTTWSADQIEILDYYLDGLSAKIPYVYSEGAELYRDKEFVCVTYGGGSEAIDDSFLQAYVALFGSEWEIEFDELSYYFYGIWSYSGEATFTVGTSQVTLSVFIYATTADGEISEDGNGYFGVDFSDGAYYGWDEFQEDYQEVLDTVYDTEDEEQEPVAFPDTINYEGELTAIEVEDDLEDNGYYVAYMYGVSQGDWNDFLDLFFDNSNWKAYEDTLNECSAFYHVPSEKVAIGYMYYASAQVGILLIHSYTKIYSSWSDVEPEVNAFIDSINDETTVSVPAFQAVSYVIEPHEDDGYALVAAFGSDDAPVTQATVDAYVAALDTSIWTVEAMSEESEEALRDDEGYLIWFNTEEEAEAYAQAQGLKDYEIVEAEDEDGVYYYFTVKSVFNFTVARSSDYAIDLQIAYNDSGYGIIVVQPRAPLSATFPASEVNAFYTAQELTVQDVPNYASSGAKFLNVVEEDGVASQIFGSSAAEAAAYISALGEAGWVVDEEASDATNHKTVLMYGETLARATVYDYSAEAGDHRVIVVFDVKVADWSDAMKAQMETSLHGIIPPFVDLGVQYSSSSDYFYSYISSSDIQAAAAMVESAFDGVEGWTYDETTGAFNSDPAADGKGYVSVYFNTSYVSSHGIYIFTIEFVYTAWSDAEEAAFAEVLHGIVPLYIRGGLYSPVTEGHNFEGNGLFTDEQIAEVAAAFQAAGWTVSATDHTGVYTKNSQDGAGYAKLTWSDYNGKYFFWLDWVDGGVVPPTPVGEGSKVDFSDKTNISAVDSVNSYSAKMHVTYNGDSWTFFGANNNNNNAKWTYVKLGHKTNASTAFIETEQVVSGNAIKITFVGIDELDRTDLSKISTIKVYVSDTAFGEEACTDESKCVVTVQGSELTAKPATEYDFVITIAPGFEGYVQIVIEIPAMGGDNNGLIAIRAVEVYTAQ